MEALASCGYDTNGKDGGTKPENEFCDYDNDKTARAHGCSHTRRGPAARSLEESELRAGDVGVPRTHRYIPQAEPRA